MMHIVAPPGSSRDLNTAYSMPQNRDPQRSIQIECPSQNSARPRCSILACSGPSGGFTECLKSPTASTPIRLSSHARGRHSDSWMLIRQFHNRVENNW
jgi:hypothetical protein